MQRIINLTNWIIVRSFELSFFSSRHKYKLQIHTAVGRFLSVWMYSVFYKFNQIKIMRATSNAFFPPVTMEIDFNPCFTDSPAKSSPTTDTNLTLAPVLQAASATLRPTPPKLCLTWPGVDVCKMEDPNDFPTVAVISRAMPPITNNYERYPRVNINCTCRFD